MEEEDIKILENYLEQQDRKFVSEYRLNFLQAIEHLIARNKELEEENFNLKEKQIIDKCEVPTQDNFHDYYAQNYLQIPVSFLTEENLDWLEQHCEKAIRYATRNELKEHQITLELIVRYKEMNKEIRDLKENKKDYIPKSKVREIVALYNNTLQCTRKYNQELADILCDLEELLED